MKKIKATHGDVIDVTEQLRTSSEGFLILETHKNRALIISQEALSGLNPESKLLDAPVKDWTVVYGLESGGIQLICPKTQDRAFFNDVSSKVEVDHRLYRIIYKGAWAVITEESREAILGGIRRAKEDAETIPIEIYIS